MSSLGKLPARSNWIPETSRAEWLWVICVSGVVLILSLIPYLVAYQVQTRDLAFNGAVLDRSDYAVHLATMQLGARGDWSYHFLFTHEPHPGAYVKLGYIALGHVAAMFRLDLPLVYQLARLAFGFSASLMIYMLLVMVFNEIYWRRVGFLLAVLGSGLGWMQLLLNWFPRTGISPVDFWLVDGYVFFSILTFPHFSAVITLVIGMIVAFMGYLKCGSTWLIACVMVFGVLAQTIQPYSIIIADIAIFGAFVGSSWQNRQFHWKDIGLLGAIALSQVPLFVYNSLIFQSGPVWEAFVAQNITLSPPPVYYLWGYFLFWPFVLIGMGKLLIILKAENDSRRVDNLPGLIAAAFWIIGILLLAYLPTVLQRRFMLGFTIPMSILSTYALKSSIFPWLDQRQAIGFKHWKGLVPVVLIAFSMISSLLLSTSTAMYAAQRPQELFDSKALVNAVDWLGLQAKQGDVVLSSEPSGLLVASKTGLPVFIGHPIETMNYQNKSIQVRDFYQGKISPDWMYQRGIRWVIWGPAEKALSSTGHWEIGLEKVFQDQDVFIYKINP
jgi:hypothetical protein